MAAIHWKAGGAGGKWLTSTSGMFESHQPISEEAHFINWAFWNGAVVGPRVETEVQPVLVSPPSAGALASEGRKKKKRRGLGVTAVPLMSHPGRQSDSRLAARLHISLPWDNRVHATAENVRFGVIQQGHRLTFSLLDAWFPLHLKYFNYIFSCLWHEKLDRKRKRCTEQQSAALLFRANMSKHPEHL